MSCLQINKAIFNSNKLNEIFKNANNIKLKINNYGIFVRGYKNNTIRFYERNRLGYVLDDILLIDLLNEHWFKKDEKVTIISENDNYNYGSAKQLIGTYIVNYSYNIDIVTFESLLPKNKNIVIFNLNNIPQFESKSDYIIFEMIYQLNDIIDIDDKYIKVYKKNEKFFLF